MMGQLWEAGADSGPAIDLSEDATWQPTRKGDNHLL